MGNITSFSLIYIYIYIYINIYIFFLKEKSASPKACSIPHHFSFFFGQIKENFIDIVDC